MVNKEMIFKDKTFNQKAGFSLVELMTVVIIIGVLATVGVPAYKDYVDRSKVVEAYQLLGTMIKGQEPFILKTAGFRLWRTIQLRVIVRQKKSSTTKILL
jgi:prepilin-type N-terminal cleavage/methylation domain-containing protein